MASRWNLKFVGQSGVKVETYDGLELGEPVTIIYLPGDPDISRIQSDYHPSPPELADVCIPGLVLLFILLLMGGIWVAMRRDKKLAREIEIRRDIFFGRRTRTDTDEEVLRCEKCHRPLGPELLDCPYQSEGTCPYHVERALGSGSTEKNWGCLIFGLMAALGGFATLSMYYPVSLCVAVLGLLSAVIGVYAMLGSGLTVTNKATGQMWQRYGMFGFKLTQFTASALQPITFDAKLRRPLNYPASICTLYRGQDAYTIFYMALLSLLSQGAIELQYTMASTRLYPFGGQKRGNRVN